MERDTQRMRPQRPWTFSNLKKGEGLQAVIDFIVERGMLKCQVTRSISVGW
jgi:urease accessory protein